MISSRGSRARQHLAHTASLESIIAHAIVSFDFEGTYGEQDIAKPHLPVTARRRGTAIHGRKAAVCSMKKTKKGRRLRMPRSDSRPTVGPGTRRNGINS
jgi:hypothetical protein